MKNKKVFYIRHMLYSALFPSFISAIALAFADIADAVVVGNRIGENGLAAIGIVAPIYMIYNILGYGLSVGGEVTHARLAASGKKEAAIRHFNKVLWTGIFWGVVLAAAGLLLNGQILFLLGAKGEDAVLYHYCRQYYLPLIAAAPLFISNYVLYDLIRSDDDPFLAGASFSIGCVFDLVLNILFVLGLGWGVSGSIAATIAAQIVTLLVGLLHFIRKKGILRITKPTVDIPGCLPVFAIGASSSVRYLFQFLFLTVANNLLIRIEGDGALYVAVFDVVMNVSYVAYSLFEGAGAAIQPLSSALYEEKDRPGLSYTLRSGIGWGMGCGSAVTLLIGIFADPTARLFGIAEPVSLQVAALAIRIFCCSVPLAGFILIMISYYLSVGWEKLSAFLTFIRSFAVLLPLTFLLGTFASEWFWLIFPITEIVSLAAAFIMIRVLRKGNVLSKVPLVSYTLENNNHEIEGLLRAAERFCEENGASVKQANLLQMAVEELCMATINKAFTGDPREYIQVTLIAGEDHKFTLHIRNRAERFDPFDMKMGRITHEEEEGFLDSMGVLVIKKKADKFYYRRSEIFNVITVVI